MLRLVTEFVTKPSFLLLCDHIGCGCYQAAVLPDGVSFENAQANFLQVVVNAGWLIGIGRQMCTEHAKQVSEKRELIQVANGALARSFTN